MTETVRHLPARRKSPLPLAVGIFVIVLISLCITGYFVWQSSHRYHLAIVQEGVLYRDGLKSAAQFAATLDQIHPRTVVSLIDAAELSDPKKPQLAQEAQLCAARNIKLVRIPVKLGGWPASDDIRRFLAIASDKQDQPVLVHCAQGVRRTGIFVAAYEESILGYDKDKAKAAIVSFGHSHSTTDDIDKFIDAYEPKTQTAPGDLGRGTE
jgi:protein tyrosine/serine phosphatase